jgi:hypothetical protein
MNKATLMAKLDRPLTLGAAPYVPPDTSIWCRTLMT